MAVSVNCPSCGGDVGVTSPASRVASCPYCNSTLIVNADAVRALGKMALLAETPSCLAVGWPATCQDREILVLGRLQYRYDAGLWDEWWVQYADDGSFAWISQDEAEYTLERPLKQGLAVPDFDSVQPGDVVEFGGRKLLVEEKNEAEMVGLQGEIPLDAGPGKPMRYLDLSDKQVHATIEYFNDGSTLAFQGKRLKRRDLVSQVPEGMTAKGELAYPPPVESQPAAKRPKIIKSTEGLKPETVSCDSCGGTVNVYDARGAAMVMCGHCGSALDVTVPGRARLLYESNLKKRRFPIEIGARGKVRGVEYVATGIVRYRETDDEGVYEWTSLQLFNPEQGYAFLELENGHWLYFTSLSHPVRFDPRRATPKQSFSFQGQRYKVFERSACRVVYVEGELSWVARLGDEVRYMDAIRPPQLLSAEWTDKEIEWSLGIYTPPEDVVKAFGLPDEKRTHPRGVAPAQPFLQTRAQRRRKWIGLVATGILLLLTAQAWMTGGTVVLQETGITSNQYLAESGYVTQPFEIPEGTHICKLAVTGSGLNNSWVALSVAFLDAEENVVLDADATVERYHGVEGGESWSEGSRNDYTLVRLTGPNTYRLNVFGDAGVWSRSGGDRQTSNGSPIDIRLARDVVPARYFLVAAIIAAAYPAWEIGRKVMFEGRRWPSEDDDD
ncbi:MAG: DUF4178 domain-containing protein [Planctomycetota bacterium]|nr:MAG: DUF4178 domain-containing protein [Planctomycetota bacterium]REK34323.1 MAG: DUF4178 domain-containing protein [Planctomycetota bacterium]